MNDEQEVLHALGIHDWFVITCDEVWNWDRRFGHLGITFERRVCFHCGRVEALVKRGWVSDGLSQENAVRLVSCVKRERGLV